MVFESNAIYINLVEHKFFSGWWYNQCGVSDLNGLYYANCICKDCNPYQTGIYWYTYKNNAGNSYSLKKAEMKMRPVSFIPSTPSP
jgi:hypothetical protein